MTTLLNHISVYSLLDGIWICKLVALHCSRFCLTASPHSPVWCQFYAITIHRSDIYDLAVAFLTTVEPALNML